MMSDDKTGFRVLIVEDEEFKTEDLRKRLFESLSEAESLGFEVLSAGTAEQARRSQG